MAREERRVPQSGTTSNLLTCQHAVLGNLRKEGCRPGFDSIIRGQIEEVKEAAVSQVVILTRRTLHQMDRDG